MLLETPVHPSEQIICSKQQSSANRVSSCASKVSVRLLSEFNSINYHFHWFTLRSDKQHWKFSLCCLLLNDQINHPPGRAANAPGCALARLSAGLREQPGGGCKAPGHKSCSGWHRHRGSRQARGKKKEGAKPECLNKTSKK